MNKIYRYNIKDKIKNLRDRRKFDNRIQKDNEEYKRLLEFFPEAVLIVSDMKVLFINDKARKLFKIYQHDQSNNVEAFKYIPDNMVSIFKEHCYNIQYCKGNLEFVQAELLDENYETIYAEIGAVYIKYDGIDSVLAIVRDVSRIKRETLMVAEMNVELQKYIHENDLLLYELRRFKHNERNMLQGLKGFIEEKNIEGLNTYLDKILKQVDNSNKCKSYPIFRLKNASLRGLIYSKMQKAKALDINIVFELNKDLSIDEKYISEIELCEVFGIYLDNAIEAAEDSKDKKIDILFFENEEYISIMIRNSMKAALENRLNLPLPSSKGVGRGSGLNYSRTILSKYNHIFSNSFTEYNYWIQEIHIKK
jgi:sensor histidine kinase regulating citrate/malate metabolism